MCEKDCLEFGGLEFLYNTHNSNLYCKLISDKQSVVTIQRLQYSLLWSGIFLSAYIIN